MADRRRSKQFPALAVALTRKWKNTSPPWCCQFQPAQLDDYDGSGDEALRPIVFKAVKAGVDDRLQAYWGEFVSGRLHHRRRPRGRASLVKLVASMGFAPVAFGTREDYVTSLDANSHGCVLLSLHAPASAGLDLLQELTNLPNPMPVIIVTDCNAVPPAVRAMQLGVEAYLQKNCFSETTLWESIHAAFGATRCSVRRINGARIFSRGLTNLVRASVGFWKCWCKGATIDRFPTS